MKGNSHKEKMQEKTTGKIVRVEKVSKPKRLLEEVFPNDPKDIGSEIVETVVIPTILDGIHSVLVSIVDAFFKRRGGTGIRATGTGSRYDYAGRSTSWSSGANRSYQTSTGVLSSTYTDNVIVPSKGKAIDILDELEEILSTCEFVSVLDFKEHLDLPTTPSDNDYGWTSMRDFKLDRDRDGWRIRCPKLVQRPR